MCGRFTLTARDLEELAQELGASPSRVYSAPGAAPLASLYRPRYNIAPTDPHWIIRRPGREDLPLPGEAGWPGPQRTLVQARWGLVPHWAKHDRDRARTINARAEGVHKRPAFREGILRRRCLVPTDGFIEWRTEGTGKARRRLPIWYHRADGKPFVFAGLHARWFPPGEPRQEGSHGEQSFTILTRPAGPEVREVHDRMPVIVPDDPELYEAWLGAADLADPVDLERLLAAFEAARLPLVATAVSPRVNAVKNDDPGCLAPVETTGDAAEEPAPTGTSGHPEGPAPGTPGQLTLRFG